MPLPIDATLALLAAIEQSRVPPELRGRRYVAMHGFDVDLLRDPPPRDHPLRRQRRQFAFRVVGEAADLDRALRLVWDSMEVAYRAFGADLEEAGMTGTWTENLARSLQNGAWGAPADEEEASVNFALHPAKRKFPRSRFVFAVFGEAPYEGEAACVLELPLRSAPAGPDRALFAACRAGDEARAARAIGAGADPNALDGNGDTPLHHAVARRNPALVRALVEAGADPNAQRDLTHSPLFAALRGAGRIGPFADRIVDEDHFRILQFLVERGADPRSKGPLGMTLVDLAAATAPLDEHHVRWFIDRGASSRMLRTRIYKRPLDDVLESLELLSPGQRARVPGEVRVLGWLGCDPNDREEGHRLTPVEHFLTTGYGADEVEPEVLIGIARALVDAGARDEVGSDGRRPSDRAAMWSKQGEAMRAYAEVARIFAGARGA